LDSTAYETSLTPDEEETWKRALLRFRTRKDEFMGQSHDSPFSHSVQTGFEGLKYFEPDPRFRFDTKLLRYPAEESVMMSTSKGTRQLYNKVGRFDVAVGGKPVQVQAYQSAEREDPSIFVPFRDATSGNESYGAARYLDLKVQHDDRYLLDFNYAYNPYCAYDDGYVCPLPPKDNWLAVGIIAGEKKYHE
jgi:uncharacterized protein (DUF1684 family)